MIEVTFDRPVKAKLLVRLENGDEFEPSVDDLRKFRLVRDSQVYARIEGMLLEALEINDWRGHDLANFVRYIVECGIMYDHSPWANEKGEPWPENDDDYADDMMTKLRRALLCDD